MRILLACGNNNVTFEAEGSWDFTRNDLWLRLTSLNKLERLGLYTWIKANFVSLVRSSCAVDYPVVYIDGKVFERFLYDSIDDRVDFYLRGVYG